MPKFETKDVSLHFEESGEGMPVLLIAPGGMRSAISFWRQTPWNPIEQLSADYRVISMDQRNAGASTAPVTAADGWHSYVEDQLALLDYLDVDRFHVVGMCIGGPYAMGLIEAAPERVASAVLMQTIGRNDNREAFYDMFDGWAEKLRATMDVEDEVWKAFRSNMYDGDDFLLNVDEAFVGACTTPLLVMEGNDLYHPQVSSQRIRDLATNVTYIERWKEAPDRALAMVQMADFLRQHSDGF